MKRILFLLFLCVPMWLFAGIIITKENGNIEDVSGITIIGDKISYVEDGVDKTIDCSAVSAVLYDNGKYEEVKPGRNNSPSQEQQSSANNQQRTEVESSSPTPRYTYTDTKSTEVNVFAYGNYIMKVYKIDHTYDGAKVEYRVIYKGQDSEPQWTYLGTTPFAYTTSSGDHSIYLKGEATQFVQRESFYIDDYQNVKKLQFRLSKEGYIPAVITPLVQVSFTGLYYFLSLNKLKPLKEGEVVDIPAIQKASSKNDTDQYASDSGAAKYASKEDYYQPQKQDSPIEEDYSDVYADEDEVKPTRVNDEQEVQAVYVPEPKSESGQKKEIVFRVSKSFLEFSETGGEKQIDVISDEAWEVTEKPSWVTIRQKSDALVVNVAQNERLTDREGDIVLLNDNQMELRIVVTQARNSDYLTLSAQLVEDVEGDGGYYAVTVSSNKEWSVNSHADWCKAEKDGGKIGVSLAPNTSGQNRTTTIEVSAIQSVTKQLISVKQSPLKNHYINIFPEIINSSGKSSVATIDVKTDMSSYRIVGLPEWCSVGQMHKDYFEIEIADNSGGGAREVQGKVIIEGGLSKTFTVRQAERLNYVSVSPKKIKASSLGGIITVNVKGSGAWRVVNLPEWCQVTDQTNDSFTLTIDKNDTGTPRDAYFSVSVSGEREQIEVRQE